MHHAQSTQPTTVNFAHYRSALKNNAIVDQAEKLLKDFKPVTYDVNSHIKVIETFEAKAVFACLSLVFAVGVTDAPFLFKVAKAKEAEEKIDSELKTLQQTLADIEEARPFDQLTVCFTEHFFLYHRSDVFSDRRCC